MAFKRGNLEKQVLEIPKEVRWCKRCVISNQRPRNIIDDNGIEHEVIKSTSTLTTREFSLFMNELMFWSNNTLNIALPSYE